MVMPTSDEPDRLGFFHCCRRSVLRSDACSGQATTENLAVGKAPLMQIFTPDAASSCRSCAEGRMVGWFTEPTPILPVFPGLEEDADVTLANLSRMTHSVCRARVNGRGLGVYVHHEQG